MSQWGANYSVGTYEALALMDVSSNRRRVLLGSNTKLLVIDVASGAVVQTQTFSTSGPSLITGRFVQPDGEAFVLLTFTSGPTYRLSWYSGSSPSAVRSFVTDVKNLQLSRDGRYLVGDMYQAKDSIVVLDSTTGAKLSTVPTPAGEENCGPSNWWSNDEFVFTCPTVSNYEEQNVWRYSISTKATTRVSRSTTGNYNRPYPTSLGTIVAHGTACSAQLGILSSDGTMDTPLAEQPQPEGSGSLFDVVGTTAYFVYESFCGSAGPTNRRSFVAYDMVAHTTVTLVASDVEGSGVESAIVLH